MEKPPEIFICYRENDTGGYAELLYERLSQQFGAEHVFRDAITLADGDYFPERVKDAIDSAKIFLPVIGSNWESLARKKHEAGETDYVYFEIKAALERQKNSKDFKFLPVLIGTTRMPHDK